MASADQNANASPASPIIATAPGSISTTPEIAQVTLAPVSAQEPAEPQNYVFPKHKLQSCPADKDPVVLLACGSFSPITYLHLRMFEMGLDAINGSGSNEFVVGGYLSPVSDAYGKKGLASASHRVKMCELATASSSWVAVDTWEPSFKYYKYTVEVMRHFIDNLNKNLKPGEKKIKVKLLCGSDLLDSFNTPNVWSETDMAEICSYGIVCLERTGSDPSSIVLNHDILYKYRNNIMLVKQWIVNEISSTKIRLALKRNLSIKYLTPDAVVDYIEREGLYKSEEVPPKPKL